jgi:hypothetical protein
MFSVDEPVYKTRMERYASSCQNKELQLREIGKRRQITSAKTRLVCSSILLVPTGGITIVGIALAIWRRRKAQKKYNIIVATMKKHDIEKPKPRKVDRAVPIAMTIVVYMATFGIVWGLDHVFSEAMMYMMPCGYVPLDDVVNVSGTEAASQFIASPDLFVQGMVHGGAGTLHFADAAATQNMSGVINELAMNSTPLGEPLAYIAGEEVGSSAVMEATRKVVSAPFKQMNNVGRKVENQHYPQSRR